LGLGFSGEATCVQVANTYFWVIVIGVPVLVIVILCGVCCGCFRCGRKQKRDAASAEPMEVAINSDATYGFNNGPLVNHLRQPLLTEQQYVQVRVQYLVYTQIPPVVVYCSCPGCLNGRIKWHSAPLAAAKSRGAFVQAVGKLPYHSRPISNKSESVSRSFTSSNAVLLHRRYVT
jgi:hypothetical protein